MVGEDRVIMSVKELRRVHVIRQTMEKQLTQVQAGTVLGLTTRHIRRLIEWVKQAGDHGLAHQGRGKPSNRRIPDKVKTTVLTLYEKRYADFGPTLATEKLAERHGITLSDETMRRWLRARGVVHFTRRKRPHRAWRARRAHVGELLQLDGSHHDWFEGRGPRCVLMAYIDDANSRVFVRVYEYEGTLPAMDSFQRYVQHYGIPLAIYADKHTTYQSLAPPTVDEQLAGITPTSQFGRALGELGGRVDRGPLPAGQGAGGAAVQDGAGSLGERAAPRGHRHDRGRKSVRGGVAAELQSALRSSAGPGRRSASAEAGGRGAKPHPVHQDDSVPAP